MINIKNKIKTNIYYNKRGYTLVELSIVILVISLLMAGVFSMATGSINNSKVALTNQKMKEVYKSMGTFLMINKRLPCPASLARSKIDDVDYGKEERDDANNNCGTNGVYTATNYSNLIIGAVPIKSLNLGSEFAEDGYENKLSYVIDKRFTKNFISPTGGNLEDSFGTVGSAIELMTAKENQVSGSTLLSDKVMFLLISHGPNVYGSFTSASGQQNIDVANNIDVDELENQIKSSSPNFDNNFIVNSYKSDVFDDVLIYKTRSNFIQDFSANNLISCPKLSNAGSFPAINLYYGQYLYDSSACASRASVIRIYKCGNISGDWTDVVSSCPPPPPPS
jgi:prepilin-type N-terminal cleavage/methylation domain-containing protein